MAPVPGLKLEGLLLREAGRQLLAAFSICTVYVLKYGRLPVGTSAP